MTPMEAVPAAVAPAADVFTLPPLPQPPPACSGATCSNGHKWPLTLQIMQCAGCGSKVLVRKQENCPQCNEPTIALHIRLDQLHPGHKVVSVCCGERTLGNTGVIHVQRAAAEMAPPTATEAILVPVEMPVVGVEAPV